MGRRSWAGAYPLCRATDYATARLRPRFPWSRQDSFRGRTQLVLRFTEQLLPGIDELLHTFVLQHDEDVRQVDSGRRERVEHALGGGSGAPDRVAADDAVVGDGVARRLRQGVHAGGSAEIG